MIRGLGVYSASTTRDILDVRDWQITDRDDVEDRLRGLITECDDDPTAFMWIGLFEPTQDELTLVQGLLDLPHLQVEDAANAMQRPKLELDPDGRGFVLVKVLDYLDESSDVVTGQIAVFVGPHYVLTIRFGEVGNLSGVRQRLSDDTTLRTHGPIAVLYAVLDLVVDGYIAVSGEIATDIEQVEAGVFTDTPSPNIAAAIYRLKRENVEIRRAVAPLVTTAHDLAAEQEEWIPPDLHQYFQDIGEHLLRAWENVEASDNLLMTMLMASTSRQDLQQNNDMRKISAWVAIAAVPTMIAGIYGMNFEVMPELHQSWAYPAVLGLMAGVCFALYRAFRRSGWL